MSVQSLQHNSHLNSAALQHATKEVLKEPFQSSTVTIPRWTEGKPNCFLVAVSPLVTILLLQFTASALKIRRSNHCAGSSSALLSTAQGTMLTYKCTPAPAPWLASISTPLPAPDPDHPPSLLCHHSPLWAVLNSLLSCSLKPLCYQHRLNPVLFKLLS